MLKNGSIAEMVRLRGCAASARHLAIAASEFSAAEADGWEAGSLEGHFTKPQQRRAFPLKPHDASELASFDSFVSLRLFAAFFGFCWPDDTKNVTRRKHLLSSAGRNFPTRFLKFFLNPAALVGSHED